MSVLGENERAEPLFIEAITRAKTAENSNNILGPILYNFARNLEALKRPSEAAAVYYHAYAAYSTLTESDTYQADCLHN